MAFSPSESPAVTVREVDLSGVVPAVTSSTGALVGDFNWGPTNQPSLVGNEAELVSTFGSPSLVVDSDNTDFLSAAAFLKYSGSLYVTRGLDATAKNAVDSDTPSAPPVVENSADWETKKSSFVGDINRIIAKYPGKAGNSLAVSICPWSTADAAFDAWSYSTQFDAAPSTSSYVSARSADSALAHDEIHVAIIDEDGKFTGQPGTVLETWPFLSLATDAKTPDGSSNFVLDVLNNKSAYIWSSAIDVGRPTNVSASAFLETTVTDTTVRTQSFSGGNQTSGTLSENEYITGFNQYEDVDTIQVDFLIAPSMGTRDSQKNIIVDLESTARGLRKDCVVVSSPSRVDVVGVQDTGTLTTGLKAFSESLPSSSYLILDNNFIKVYDKYSDEYVFIPAASSTAGLMASSDASSAAWYSPAGSRRGQYFGVSSLAWNATKSQRDTLYKVGVNPIVNLPGQGVLLYGDKTKLARPSAFDRINVRRLFLVMERAIKVAAQNVMFEFNDEFTRAEFVNIVEPFLREIKGRRGITDFRVVCDDTNNTSQVIDNNQFVADIYVKPARSINYVTLSFVAVRTGVDFDEVVGLA
jgi:hypothetical protein